MKLTAGYGDFRVFNLVQEGVLLKTDKVKVVVRLKRDYVETPTVCILGWNNDDSEPVMLSAATEINTSDCTREMISTTVIETTEQVAVTDIMVRINHLDEIEDVYNIVGVFDTSTVPQGTTAETGDFPCENLAVPIATDATSIGATSFTANWGAATGATGYKLDISTDIDFSTFELEDETVAGTSYNASGLDENTCYFYRVRSYNDDFTSRNSNIIHVGDISLASYYVTTVHNTSVPDYADKDTLFNTTNGSIVFDLTQFIKVPIPSITGINVMMTCEFEIAFDPLPSTSTQVFTLAYADGKKETFGFASNRKAYWTDKEASGPYTTATALSDTNFHKIKFERKPDTSITIYIDDVQDYTQALSLTANESAIVACYIGLDRSNGKIQPCQLKWFKWYSGANYYIDVDFSNVPTYTAAEYLIEDNRNA